MRLRPFVFTFAVVVALADGGAWGIDPATQPERYLIEGRWYEPSAHMSWGDLITVGIVDGRLSVTSKPSDAADKVLRGDRSALVEITGTHRAWTITAAGRRWDVDGVTPTQNLQVTLSSTAAASTDRVQLISARITPRGVFLMGSSPTGTVALQINGRSSELVMSFPSARGGMASFRAQNVLQLLIDHPVEARLYTAALLAEMAPGRPVFEPQGGDVAIAFESLIPTPRAQTDLVGILSDFDAVDPAVRDHADRMLDHDPAPLLVAAAHLKSSTLRPEQRLRIDRFIHRNCLYPHRTADDYLRDTHFLIDCLGNPEHAVRIAAANAIQVRRPDIWSARLNGDSPLSSNDRIALHLQASAPNS